MNSLIVVLTTVLLILSVTSGLLYRVFINTLMTAGIVTLTAWIGLLLIGIFLCYGVPIYCGLTGKDLATTYSNLEKGNW